MAVRIIAGLLIFFLVGQGVAVLPEAGLTPDHPLYLFERLWENLIELPMARVLGGERGLARKHLELAGERVAEAAMMAMKERLKHIPRLMDEYQRHVDEAIEIAEGLNRTDVYVMVYNATLIHQTVLESVQGIVPEEARQP